MRSLLLDGQGVSAAGSEEQLYRNAYLSADLDLNQLKAA